MGAATRLEVTVNRRSVQIGSALRIGGAILLVVVAVLAALLAADVRAWQFALDRGDAAYAVSPGHATWRPPTHLGGLAASILGVGDDVALRQGISLYRQVVSQQESLNNQLAVETLRAQAERALARPAASSDPSIASQARTLLGILAFGAAAHGAGNQANTAISDFTAAITADPSDTAPKYNLEQLLRLSAPTGSRRKSGAANGFGRTGQGASGGSPGSGY
jgi:hypothetical protein